MRLIDADELAKKWTIASPEPYNTDAVEVLDSIREAPTIDAVPMVHGRWENGNPICPVCGGNKFKNLDADIWCDWQPSFCPNCGAKMDG